MMREFFSRRNMASAASFFLPGLVFCSLLMTPLVTAALGNYFRYGFDTRLLLVFLLLAAAYSIRGRSGPVVSLSATIALFSLPLAGLWASGASEMQVMGGLVFFSDAFRYYTDVLNLLGGHLFSTFSARHPLAPGFLAALMSPGGHNLQVALAVLVLLNALAAHFAARQVQKRHGVVSGTLFAMLIFLFYRRFTGIVDAENLGLLLGTVSFALLWSGAWERRKDLALPGILLASLALNTRPGAFFVLPALVFWFSRVFRSPQERGLKTFSSAACMVFLGFAANLLVFLVTSPPGGKLYSNYAYTFYGLATGGTGWTQVYRDYPEIMKMPEPEAERLVFRRVLEELQDHPGAAAAGMLRSLGDFFSLRDESLFGFVCHGELVSRDIVDPEKRVPYLIVRSSLYGLSLAGLLWCVRERREPHSSLLLYYLLGILLSVPLIPPRDAAVMRVYAAAIPALAVLPAVGADILGRKFAREGCNGIVMPSENTMLAFGMALAALLVTGPLFVRLMAHEQAPAAGRCAAGERSMVVDLSRGSYIRVLADASLSHTWMPDIRLSDFAESARSYRFWDMSPLAEVQTPALVANVVDLESGTPFWLVLEAGLYRGRQRITMEVCGDWSPLFSSQGLGFFYARTVYPLYH